MMNVAVCLAGMFMVDASVAPAEPYWRGKEASPGPAVCTRPAATGVKVVCDRWPDGSDLRQFGLDAMRLSDAKTDQEKAIAVWRWVRRWTMYTDGNIPTEKALKRPYVDDPIKVLNVYGTHWCDGLARAMELVWRAQGGRAEKLYRGGHTMCDVFYRDTDGVDRWHLYDVSEGGYMFDRSRTRVLTPGEMSTDVYNYMATWIHCSHLGWPTHRVELALRQGESLERLWGNERKPYQDNIRRDHQTVPESERGPYPINYGNGTLTYEVPIGESWKDGLAAEPVNLTSDGRSLAPVKAGELASAVWRIRSPYVIAGATVEIGASVGGEKDIARLLLSVDEGKTWKTVWEPIPACHNYTMDICPTYTVTMKADPPKDFVSPFGRYSYLLKLELRAEKPREVGISRLVFRTVVQHNVYALPQLQPGRNRITVSGALDPTAALVVTYLWDDKQGKERKHGAYIESTPFTYDILTDGAAWNDVLCQSVSVRAMPRMGEGNHTTEQEARAVRPAPPLGDAAETRFRWQRPVEGKPVSLEQCLAVLAGKSGSVEPAASDAPDGVEETQAPPPGTSRPTPSRPAAPALDVRDALAALNDFPDPKAFDAVKKAVYERAGKNEKERAVVALYSIDPKRAVPVLLDVLDHPEKATWKEDPKNPAVARGHWCGVATVIAEIAVKERCTDAVPGLLKVLDCPDAWDDVRWQVVRALGRLGDPRAREAVRKRLTDKDGDLVVLAALAAGQLGDQDAIPELRKLLASGFELNRENAAYALGMLGDSESAPALRKMLADRDENLRAAAAEALGRLKDPAAVPLLKAMAESDPFPWVRDVARKATEKT